MRKLLELLAAAALLALLYVTWAALYGPSHLSGQIPTHFGPDGQPTMLLAFPLIAVVLYALMTAVSFYPSAFHYPVRVTAQNRARLQRITLRLIAFLKAETLSLFAAIQYETIQAIRQQSNSFPVLLMPLALVFIFLTIALHIAALRRAA